MSKRKHATTKSQKARHPRLPAKAIANFYRLLNIELLEPRLRWHDALLETVKTGVLKKAAYEKLMLLQDLGQEDPLLRVKDHADRINKHIEALATFLDETDRICRDIWQRLGQSVTPEFIRDLLLPMAKVWIGVYKENAEKMFTSEKPPFIGDGLEKIFGHLKGRCGRLELERRNRYEKEYEYLLLKHESAAGSAKRSPQGIRKSHREDVRKWMDQQQIASIESAARRLGISSSALKSIMSDRGQKRYSDERLEQVLQQIRATV